MKIQKSDILLCFILMIMIVSMTSCQTAEVIEPARLPTTEETLQQNTKYPVAERTLTPTKPITATVTSGLLFDNDVPEWVQELLSQHIEIQQRISDFPNGVEVGFTETAFQIGNIQYFLVAPFDLPLTSISLNEFNYIWSVSSVDDNAWKGSFLLSEESERILRYRWGEHGSGVNVVQFSEEELIASLFNGNHDKIAIIPAQHLSSELRTIRIDNKSFFQTGDNLVRSVFNVPLYSTEKIIEEPISINFSTDRLTTVNITGVTALVRATAVLMRINGNAYPAEQIIDILTLADYTHISNEVSFSPFCPVQQYTSENLLFCSPDKNFELLTFIDADIIELSGDHLADYGADAFLYTLELYESAGIQYYGGGRNLSAAQKPLKIDHNGNKFAFLGCNAKNQSYARAAENYPGTWLCDLDFLKESIMELQAEGYTPIVTIQHVENELNTPPQVLVDDFSNLSTQTPIILIGSQAHITKPIILDENSFIHFGLGNLFFDQINESEAHAEALIDRLIFYNNQLINIELFPIRFIDYAQSRPMTSEEEFLFLSKLFASSTFPLP